MVFSTTLFLFVFLPLVVGLHAVVKWTPLRNLILLIASLVFYTWGETIYVWVLLLSVSINYVFGLLLHFAKQSHWRWLSLVAGVTGNILILLFFKYAGFFANNLAALIPSLEPMASRASDIHLPLGISFFTFQAITYLVDIHRGEAPVQKSLPKLMLYITLFPQLVAGPIVRYKLIAKRLSKRWITLRGFADGAERFTIGLAKKVLIANNAGLAADTIFELPAGQITTPLAWVGVIAYTIQIFFDFSGYSDMAIGIGRMLGFRFPENFNYPYIAKSIQEFWRRWHMTLSLWFRDYLYIPLGGNRKGNWRTAFNLVLVFVLCGLWHGASWNFLIWGLFHGVFLVAERGRFGSLLRKLPPLFRRGYTLLVVITAWVFFRADTLPEAWSFLKAMYGFGAEARMGYEWEVLLTRSSLFWIGIGIVASSPFIPRVFHNLAKGLQRHSDPGTPSPEAASSRWLSLLLLSAARPAWLLFLLCFCAAYLFAGSFNPFIYFRF